MDGMPCSVSVVTRTTLTSLLPRWAYSTSQIAAKMPSGVEIASEKAVISTVLMSAGVSETFSELYSQANSSGFKLGMPMTRM